MRRIITITLALVLFGFADALALGQTRAQQRELIEVTSFPYDRPTGTAVSKHGRFFVTLPYGPYSDNRHSASVVEVLADGTFKPYPNSSWNTKPKDVAGGKGNPSEHFIMVQSNTIDADDNLWLLDTGSPKLAGVIPSGAKLVKIDLKTDKITQIIPFDSAVVTKKSFLNDVRVDALRGFAYVTETGTGGVIVVNLRTGEQRRALRDIKWVQVEPRGPVVEGIAISETLRQRVPPTPDGIALDAQGEYLYLHTHPWQGRNLYRVRTEFMRDTRLSSDEVGKRVERVGTTVFADGIQIDSSGAIYFTDVERNAISRLRPGRQVEVIVQDERIKWPDSIALSSDGYLYFPIAQFHRLPSANNGVDKSLPPFKVYKVRLQK